MQKKILLIVVCFTLNGVYINAQSKKHFPTPPVPPPPPTMLAMDFSIPAPPPPPSVPPIPPAPPAAPVPPLPPVEPKESEIIAEPVKFIAPVIINNNGYECQVKSVKGKPMIYLEKNSVTQKIKLVTWNTKRKYYEKKYGQLPQLTKLKAGNV